MKFQKILIYNLIFLAISDSFFHLANSGSAGTLIDYITPISLAAKIAVLYSLVYFARKSNWEDDLTTTVSILFKLLLAWNIINIIRGIFSANGYWEWKFLFFSTGFFFLVPLAFFVGKSLSLARAALQSVLKYFFAFGFLAIPVGYFTVHHLYARLMIPISFFIVMIPYLKSRHKILVVLVAIVSVCVAYDLRANIVKIAISILVLLTWYFRKFIALTWLKILHITLFILPLPLLYLAASGQYNIFNAASQNESFIVKDKKLNVGEDESLTADTRTLLYVEVFKTLNEQNDWLFGQGAVGKYKTHAFDDKAIIKGERFGSEVGFLNTLLYSGIVGVILYALLVFTVSRNAIFYSNNWLSKMLGIVVMSRWMQFFLEEYTQFDLNLYFLWIIIGLISTRQFRAMTDQQIKNFISPKKRNLVTT